MFCIYSTFSECLDSFPRQCRTEQHVNWTAYSVLFKKIFSKISDVPKIENDNVWIFQMSLDKNLFNFFDKKSSFDKSWWNITWFTMKFYDCLQINVYIMLRSIKVLSLVSLIMYWFPQLYVGFSAIGLA